MKTIKHPIDGLNLSQVTEYHKLSIECGYYKETETEMNDCLTDSLEDLFYHTLNKTELKKAERLIEELKEYITISANLLERKAQKLLKDYNKSIN